MPPNFNTQPYFAKTCPYSLHFYVLRTIHIVNINEWTNKNTVVCDLDKFGTITERDLNTILMMKIWLRNNDATPTQHKRRNGKRNFAIQKHQRYPQEKATATAWRISEDFAKRVSAKPRSAPCRLLRNWVCFYAKTCRSLARAYARALVSKTTARLTVKLLKYGLK